MSLLRRRLMGEEDLDGCLAFTSVGDSSVYLTKASSVTRAFQYSYDRITWTNLPWKSNTQSNTITFGSSNTSDTVYFRGLNADNLSSATYVCHFIFNGAQVECKGNLAALLDYTVLPSDDIDIPNSYCFQGVFGSQTRLLSTPKIVFRNAKQSAFQAAFKGCTNLRKIRKLKITGSMPQDVCREMFMNCTSLSIFPADFLMVYPDGWNACMDMFKGCTSIVTAPNLSGSIRGGTNSMDGMFENCTGMVNGPEIGITTFVNTGRTCDYMFLNCTSLSNMPDLHVTTFATYAGMAHMFENCTSLTRAPALPATTCCKQCYEQMFKGCTALVTPPVLPATTLEQYCYREMFKNCTSLVNAPALPATTLNGGYCYQGMYEGCTSLVNVPALPATAATGYCYNRMFYGCTSLVTAPTISILTLTGNCLNEMFYGCTKLKYIKCMTKTALGTSFSNNWVSGVASSGTFVKNSAATWSNTFSTSAIPTGWTVQTASS